MAATRKLQGEIDRCKKKISEGVETFEDIWSKVTHAVNNNQKEKYEADLKKEIKKLQRLRDQIKTWQTCPEVKDKSDLIEHRKLIETQMERFKGLERETKTKAYSKEGLGAAVKLDPVQKQREDCTRWLSHNIEQLNVQIDQFEAELDGLSVKKRRDKDKSGRIEIMRHWIERHRYHIKKLETILRLLDNNAIDLESVRLLQEDVEYYTSANQECDFRENEFIYCYIDTDHLEELYINDVGMADTGKCEEQGEVTTNSFQSSTSPSPLNHISGGVAATTSQTTAHESDSTCPTVSAGCTNAASTPSHTSASRRSSKRSVSETDVLHHTQTQHSLQTHTISSSLAGKSKHKHSKQHAAHSHATTSATSSVSTSVSQSSHSAATPALLSATSQQQQCAVATSRGISTTVSTFTVASTSACHSAATLTSSHTTHTSSTCSVDTLTPGGAGVCSVPNFASVVAAAPNYSGDPAATSGCGTGGTTVLAQPLTLSEICHTASDSQCQLIAESAALTHATDVPSALSVTVSTASTSDTSRAHNPVDAGCGTSSALAHVGTSVSAADTAHTPLSEQTASTSTVSAVPPAVSAVSAAVTGSVTASCADTSLSALLLHPYTHAQTLTNANQKLGSTSNLLNRAASNYYTSTITSSGLLNSNDQILPHLETTKSNKTHEVHISPLHGVAPLGPVPINKDLEYQFQMLQCSFNHMPQPSDSERLRTYLPRCSYPTPPYYPKTPLPGSDSFEYFMKLSVETLFFIFYYMEGTKAQYLAAKALKKQSWRFHTKYMMWFQRFEEPKQITDEFEQGTYLYFDFEKWSTRKKDGFKFEYRFLEDQDLS